MSVEFVDTNILVYSHDRTAGAKRTKAGELLTRLIEEECGVLSIQVLAEFYWTATRKLRIESDEAQKIIRDFGTWQVHHTRHEDLLKAAQLQRRHKISWWDALIVCSAMESGCSILWTEDLSDGQRFGSVVVRNPFR